MGRKRAPNPARPRFSRRRQMRPSIFGRGRLARVACEQRWKRSSSGHQIMIILRLGRHALVSLILAGSIEMANGEGKPSIAVPPPDVRQGRNFAFNLPPQWQIAEEGNHVLYLRAPDQSAGIVVAGLSGLNFPLNPAAFAQHIFATVLRIAAPLRFINNWGLNPFTGYTSAEAFEVSYAVPDGQGIRPMHGPTHPAAASYISRRPRNRAGPPIATGCRKSLCRSLIMDQIPMAPRASWRRTALINSGKIFSFRTI